MIRDNIKKIGNEISGERMMDRIREISCFHRIQASDGYRAAAEKCRDRLLEYGIESEILYYDAKDDKRYLTMQAFQEWNCSEAWCKLVIPSSIPVADYSSDNLSIIQKSYPCNYRNEPLDIVLLDRGCEESAYDGLDLSGKIIFVRDNFNSYLDWAVRKGGAVGIITDHIAEVNGGRSRYDLLDIKKYNTFWWTKDNSDIHAFGFVMTPRQGDRLAETCRKMRDENERDSAKPRYPKASCFIDSSFCDGTIENVSGILHGESSEEILITAHLCHPRSSANDNASGVAAAMEVLKTLNTLILKGELKPLKRTIRILLIPEYTGLYAYLDSIGDERRRIKAGINLDMVGGKQEKGYGPLTLSGLPRSTPSFVMDLAALIMDEQKKEVPGFSPGSLVPMFNSAIAEFTGGSDNFILSDPTIGIPAPMLGQWPDMYYHTSGDTPEVISTHILSKSAGLAAAYAYTLATLKSSDMPEVFGRANVRMHEELNSLIGRALNSEIDSIQLIDGFDHYTNYYLKSCEDCRRFFTGNEKENAERLIELECDRILKSSRDMLSHYFKVIDKEAPSIEKAAGEERYDYIPKRKYISPVNQVADYTASNDSLKEALNEYSKKYRNSFKDSYYAELLIQYYIDGSRTASQIAKCVITDCRGGDAEAVHQYISLLIKLGLAE